MSVFGDGRYQMNQLYEDIECFFSEGGSLPQFFEVLEYFFNDKELEKESE